MDQQTAAAAAAPVAERSFVDDTVQYVLKNKLKTVLYTWAGGITACMAYEWSRPTPTSLKVIHSRVYAQAITLAALGAVGAIEIYAQSTKQAPVKDKHGY